MWGFCLILLCGYCGVHSQLVVPIQESTTAGVNECSDTTICPTYATCTNTFESYFCTCKEGFLSSNGQTNFRGPGVECKDVDECSQHPPRCGPNSVCTNLPGRYKCSCLRGFSSPTGNNWISRKPGRFACSDVNECILSGVCPEHSDCANSMGSYSCTCHAGFISKNSICEDVEECANPRACPEHASCHNTFGSYSCSCNSGFASSSGNLSFQGPGGRCEDVDECSRNLTLCGPNSVCINIPGKYNCSCLPGFFSTYPWTPGKTDVFQCKDIDECVDTCPFNSTCTNTPGSFFCTCLPGFAPSNGQLNFKDRGVECKDIDECSQDPSPCGPNSVCSNALGSYSCNCTVGFRPSPEGSWKYGNFSCKSVNKCSDTTICPTYATCTNTFESYFCTCKEGFLSSNGQRNFRGPGVECKDVDECSQHPPRCGPNSVCTNLPGRYKCSCLRGFSSPTGNNWISGKPGRFACSDVNECILSGVCPEHSDCANSMGSYSCTCHAGFISKNSICEDVEECANPRACPEHASCHNTFGSYSCSCNSGFASSSGNLSFQGPGGRCEDVDECSRNLTLCGPNSICINIPGKYNCSCLPGFFSTYPWTPGKTDVFQCKDIDECIDTCPFNSTCTNTPGSFFCTCLPGFAPSNGQLNFKDRGVECKDIDECSQDPSPCGQNSVCSNALGSYSCNCTVGFRPSPEGSWKYGNFSCKSVNKCSDTTICPIYATCTNTFESYFCTCKEGFLSSNGQRNFRGPGVECKDVDECSQHPPRCGPNSVCTNLPGRYKCSCLRGFSSPTGNNWISGKPGRFACSDVNECILSGVCPEHSDCANSMGSYSCTCHAGFISKNSICEDVDECSRNLTLCGPNSVCINIPGKYNCSCLPGFFPTYPWTPGKTDVFQCKDIDECVDTCPFNSTCTNTPGSFFCTCLPGFVPSNGELNFKDRGVECKDIDECSQDPSLCGPNSVCSNALGSYSCNCTVGFRPSPEGSWKYGNFSCKRIPFKYKEDMIPNNEQVQLCEGKAAKEPEYASFCELMSTTFGILDDACKNKTTTISLKKMAEHFGTALEQTHTWSSLTKEETSTLATVLLESVESTTLAAFRKPSANVSQTIQTKYLAIESKIIKEECIQENTAFYFKAKGDTMKIGCSTVEESGSSGTTGVAFVSFEGMESILDVRFFQDPHFPLTNSKRKLKMNSRIVRGIMTGEEKDGFSDPVIYTLENIQPKQKFESSICVTWDTNVDSGRWTSSDCVILNASETHTVCSCKRLGNLAIIVASGDLTMEYSLYLISYVGLIISLVCLVCAIATFLLCRSIHNRNTDLHLHVCVSLFLAKLLFLTGVDKTDNQLGCAIITGFLHYLFLACFFWMLVEAVMLFLMVRNLKVANYFSSRNIKMLHLCVIGYGLPGLVVLVSASVQPKGYGMHDRCWLNTETGFIWSFLGPICTIIMINSVLLTWTLLILRQKLSSVNAEVLTLKDTRLLTFKAFAQVFILGCSWVLGIFQIGAMARVMAYLFTIINSLQGAFIFLIHCLLSRQVREEYRRWFTAKTKPSSQSQTSGIALLSLSSSSRTG
ncbi:adhesion G protein-coupled receptor E1-like [Dasypus novemcinctus]|uniref:adhesion G protein-coupled receptor E1-like n=1 Tax=Dasypus novemcinctus TaxID=9361 RepID=UPI00265FCE6D|nr:adhesion G protein-coupled receptor E1-like [Dasypus novemcinctus]